MQAPEIILCNYGTVHNRSEFAQKTEIWKMWPIAEHAWLSFSIPVYQTAHSCDYSMPLDYRVI